MITIENKNVCNQTQIITLCKVIISNEEINEFLPRYKLHTYIIVWNFNDNSPYISVY